LSASGPFDVSRQWFAFLREKPEENTDKRVRWLAAEFGVTQSAMRVRVEQMKLVR